MAFNLLLIVVLLVNTCCIAAEYCSKSIPCLEGVCCWHDCVRGSSCAGRYCVLDSDCATSEACCNNKCVRGPNCLGQSCILNSDCSSSDLTCCKKKCVNGTSCVGRYCVETLDCNIGESCCGNKCWKTLKCKGLPCTKNSDCPSGMDCCFDSCDYRVSCVSYTVEIIVGSVVGTILFTGFILVAIVRYIKRRRRFGGILSYREFHSPDVPPVLQGRQPPAEYNEGASADQIKNQPAN